MCGSAGKRSGRPHECFWRECVEITASALRTSHQRTCSNIIKPEHRERRTTTTATAEISQQKRLNSRFMCKSSFTFKRTVKEKIRPKLDFCQYLQGECFEHLVVKLYAAFSTQQQLATAQNCHPFSEHYYIAHTEIS